MERVSSKDKKLERQKQIFKNKYAYRNAGISKRGTNYVVNNHKKKEELDFTYSEGTKSVKALRDVMEGRLEGIRTREEGYLG